MKATRQKLISALVISSAFSISLNHAKAELNCSRESTSNGASPFEIIINLIAPRNIQSTDQDCIQRMDDAIADTEYTETLIDDHMFRGHAINRKTNELSVEQTTVSKTQTEGVERTVSKDTQQKAQSMKIPEGYTTVGK